MAISELHDESSMKSKAGMKAVGSRAEIVSYLVFTLYDIVA